MSILDRFFLDDRSNRRVRESRLSAEQIRLFNGFDEIGGDISKYDDAIRWYNNCPYKNEALVLCLIVLDKPSSYLFGGRKNADIKSFWSVLPQIEMSLSTLGRDGTEIEKARDLSNLENAVAQCSFLRLDSERVNIKDPEKIPIDKKLMRSLALYSVSEIESFDADQKGKMSKSRAFWSENFSLVNVSRMKRVAMMYLEMCPEKHMINQGGKWIKKHGGRPSRAKRFGSNQKTIEIMSNDIAELMSNKDLWSDYKKIWKKELADDMVDEDEDDVFLAENQNNFVEEMKAHLPTLSRPAVQSDDDNASSDGTSNSNVESGGL